MRTAIFLALLLIIAVVVLLIAQPGSDLSQRAEQQPADGLASQQSDDADDPGLSITTDTQNNTSSSEPNPYENEALKSQVMQIADLYAESARYPHFSQPILNPQDFQEPEPYSDTEVDTPFPQADEEQPIRLQLATERYQYYSGENIRARLRITNTPPEAFVSASGVLSAPQGDTPLRVGFQTGSNPNEMFADFNTAQVPAHLLADEMLLKVEVNVDGAPMFTTVGFRYQNADARLVSIAWVRPEGPFLNIALQYQVDRPGYYFSQGILVDAASNQPVVQLQAEGQMQQGNAILVMRAHIQALRAVDSPGPYLLRSIRSYRGAESGETFDTPAANLTSSYQIPGFPFDQYEDSEYVDPLAQERIDFLRELGGVGDSEGSTENDVQSTDPGTQDSQ